MYFRKSAPIMLGAVCTVALFTGACATKKHVREAIAPVQNQVNEVSKKTDSNTSAIGDLDRNVARVDERAMEANRNATSAGQAASKANDLATQAQQRADAANSLAQQANDKTGQLSQRMDNLDNYKLANTEKVYFHVNRATLDQKAKAELDSIIGNLNSQKNYVLEVEGYTDRTGPRSLNLALSERRADAVRRYLVEHDVPLRKIHVIGVGEEESQAARTRAARNEERRVDVKLYTLEDMNTAQNQTSTNTMPTQTPTQPGR
jgi:OmpA-OmpF porin, OOP family